MSPNESSENMHAREATLQYLSWMNEVKDPSPHTIRAYRGDLTQWLGHIGEDRPIGDVPPDCVHSFILSQRCAGMSRRTIGRRVAAVRGLYRWLVSGDHLTSGQWDLLSLPSGKVKTLPRVATVGDVESLHRYLRNTVLRTGDITNDVRRRPGEAATLVGVSVMIATGTRVAETCAITIPRLDLGSGSIRVLGKGRRDRTVYVTSDWLLELLRAFVSLRTEQNIKHNHLLFNRLGDPLTPASVRYRLAVAGRAAGLTSLVTPHMLRHEAATRLLEAGVDIRIVQRLLGHASITTTEIYTHVNDVALRQALLRANVLERVMSSG